MVLGKLLGYLGQPTTVLLWQFWPSFRCENSMSPGKANNSNNWNPSRRLICSIFLVHSSTNKSTHDVGDTYLVGGWTNPFEKYDIVKLVHLPRDRGKNSKKKNGLPPLVAPCNFLTQDSGWQKSAIFSRAFEVTNNKQRKVEVGHKMSRYPAIKRLKISTQNAPLKR